MKKIIALLLLITMIVSGYVLAGPYMAVNRLEKALQNRDSAMLAQYVDFPVLRENLKEQINESLLKELKEMEDDDPFAAFGIAFLSLVIDGLVDMLLTPTGIGSLALGILPDLVKGEVEEVPLEQAKFFANARYTIDGFSQVSLWMENGSGDVFRFIFSRYGLTWKLSNVIIPL